MCGSRGAQHRGGEERDQSGTGQGANAFLFSWRKGNGRLIAKYSGLPLGLGSPRVGSQVAF